MSAWVEIGVIVIIAALGFVWNNLIERRFRDMVKSLNESREASSGALEKANTALVEAIKEITKSMKENHTEIKIAISNCMTNDKCKIFHDAHDKEHERFEKDINNLGGELETHIRETK